MAKLQSIKIIKREEILTRVNQHKRTEIAMLKILLEKYFPGKVRLIFPLQNIVDRKRDLT